ncbi:hypothetical protein KKF34_14295 [Myxococcota bacterium]|nr:hypothetical protein [Myxococcota bacterium]MBU1380728.1 hypothetical protein [Myxococcota bacterium]MBU1498044.1 hypothetical protein [Myxococcota bacterium]
MNLLKICWKFTLIIILTGIVFVSCDDDSAANNTNNTNNLTNNSNNTNNLNNTNNSNNTNNLNNTNNTNNLNNTNQVGFCEPLAAATGNIITVTPSQAGELRQIVTNAPEGSTIQLEDGFYDMSSGDSTSRIVMSTPGVTLRSASGIRENVILDGNYATDELISIYASDVTVADITLRRAYNHPIHASGSAGNPISGLLIYNVRIEEPGEQAIKINPAEDGWVDFSAVRCSHISLSDEGRPHIRNNCYTGGIDAHKAWGWEITDNYIEGFYCNEGLSEHAIHFWQNCRDTLVERNVINNCARGIGFGLGETVSSRPWEDNPYPDVVNAGHIDGIIRNNFIAASSASLFATSSSFDCGICLEQAHGTVVAHNSVASTQAPFSSIEWRWGDTLVYIYNNLVTHNLRDRGGSSTLDGNTENADSACFASISEADLHIDGECTVNSTTDLENGVCDFDIDGEQNVGEFPGADQ